MVINECDAVKTLVDKKFENGFVPANTIGYVMHIGKDSQGNTGFILEIPGINEDDPLFEYDYNEVELVKKFK